MKVIVINHCKKTYKPDAEKIIAKILGKIPAKFLNGLEKVELFDFGKEEYPMMRYVKGTIKEKSSIEVYMDSPDFSGIPFFSALGLNVHFINMINEHIDKTLKHKSNDKEISEYPTAMANYEWMYLGIWNPLLSILKILNYLFSRISILKKALSYWIKNLEKEGR